MTPTESKSDVLKRIENLKKAVIGHWNNTADIEWVEKYVKETAEPVEQKVPPPAPEPVEGEDEARASILYADEIFPDEENQREWFAAKHGFIAGSRWQQGQQPSPTIGARWVSMPVPTREKFNPANYPAVEVPFIARFEWLGTEVVSNGYLAEIYKGEKVICFAFVTPENKHGYPISNMDYFQRLDESPCILHAGWMSGTPKLDKPCLFVSKSGGDYSVWEVINLNTGDGSYLAICDGDGNEWGDISDFRCDSYYMLSPTTFPTREQAIEKVSWLDKEDPQRVAALTMYDWIIEQINKPS